MRHEGEAEDVYSKILMLRFSAKVSQKPVVCYLTQRFDLTFNILNATILPRQEGVMVLELSGERKQFREGVKFLKAQGVDVQNADQEVKRLKNRCTDCGACTAVCPTGALEIERPSMSVNFVQHKCSVCELCIPACPSRAMTVRPINKIFFEE
jgi:ferredoxin